MTRRLASFRLRPEAIELLAAWANHHNTSQSRIIERLLQRQPPPEALGPNETAVRIAHRTYLRSLEPKTP